MIEYTWLHDPECRWFIALNGRDEEKEITLNEYINIYNFTLVFDGVLFKILKTRHSKFFIIVENNN